MGFNVKSMQHLLGMSHLVQIDRSWKKIDSCSISLIGLMPSMSLNSKLQIGQTTRALALATIHIDRTAPEVTIQSPTFNEILFDHHLDILWNVSETSFQWVEIDGIVIWSGGPIRRKQF